MRSLRSLVSDGPRVGLPVFGRALVLAPHPDDETVGCGGTLALLARRGCVVTTVVLSDGAATPGCGLSPAEVASRRADEVRRACAELGAPPPILCGLPDGQLQARLQEMTALVAGQLRAAQPDVVLVPWAGDGHDDHRAVLRALLACAGPDTAVWGYEVWSPLPWTNRVVDVSAVMPAVARAAAQHVTAAGSMDLDALLALRRYRSLHGMAGRGHAEAFLELTALEHLRLLDELAPISSGVQA